MRGSGAGRDAVPARPHVNEVEFWEALEYRICRELAGTGKPALRYGWCDGFDPLPARFDEGRPRIVGRIHISFGPDIEFWQFTLVLDPRTTAGSPIDWQAHLPPENVTAWLTLDRRRRHVLVDPLAAVPEPP